MPRSSLRVRLIRSLVCALLGVLCGVWLHEALQSESATGAFQRARTLYAQGQVDDALRVLARLRDDPQSGPEALYWMGRIHWEQGRWLRAEQAWELVLERQPNYAEAIWGLLDLYEAESRVAEAEELVLRSWSAEPDPANRKILLVRLLVMHCEEPGPEQLIPKLTKVVEREPANTAAVRVLALSYARLGQSGVAQRLLHRALSAVSGRAELELRLQLAETLLDAGESEQAAAELDRVQPLIRDSSGELSRQLLAWYWWLRGRSVEVCSGIAAAVAAYERAVQAVPSEARYRFSYARALQAIVRVRDAQEQFAVARKMRDARQELVRIFRRIYAKGGPTPSLCAEVADVYRTLGKAELAKLWQRLADELSAGGERMR